MTRAPSLAAQFARITRETAYEHRKHDEAFAQQWDDAIDHATELLHSRCFQRALEGDCEPVWYMGIRVGYVRKYDSKLQIEMLRAYKPDTFKTAGVNVNVGIRSDTLVLTEDMRHKLMEYNRKWLEDPKYPRSRGPTVTNCDASTRGTYAIIRDARGCPLSRLFEASAVMTLGNGNVTTLPTLRPVNPHACPCLN
jgi:hypothetical protein